MPTNFYLVCPRVTSYWERGIPTIVIHAPSPKSVGREGVYSIVAPIMQHATMTQNPQFSSSFGNLARSHRLNQFPPS
ncbi:hypothetical protein JHK84_043337 [Glycine max]|nr:hypothetical protein JHK84_043337 [Glycine max]